MSARIYGNGTRSVVIDLNTQMDFMSTEGAAPLTNLDDLIPAMRRVVAWVKRNHVPVISSLSSHRRLDFWRDDEPHCCVDGTPGQRKIEFTMLASSVRIEGDNTLCVPVDLFNSHQQVMFRQRTFDLFANPKADRFITQLPTEEFIICGASLDMSIKALSLGLLARRRRVTIPIDACGFFQRDEADLALRQLEAKGAELITTQELLARKLPRSFRYPHHVLQTNRESELFCNTMVARLKRIHMMVEAGEILPPRRSIAG